MEINPLIKKMKLIYSPLIDFIEADEDCETKFQTLIQVNEKHKILQSNEDFEKEFTKLSSVHHIYLKKIEGYITENQFKNQPENLPGIFTIYENLCTLTEEFKEDLSSSNWNNLGYQVVFLFAVASALNKLHEKKIYHGDLKPNNIFVLKDNEKNHGFYLPLICDYGLASISETEGEIQQLAYRAPELINGIGSFEPNEKTDVFSFGMLVFYIFLQKYPRGKSATPLLSGKRPELPKTIPHGVRKIIVQCWDHDPSQRPSMKTVMKSMIELRCHLEFPEVGEFMYEIEPQLFSLTEIYLLHHVDLKK